MAGQSFPCRGSVIHLCLAKCWNCSRTCYSGKVLLQPLPCNQNYTAPAFSLEILLCLESLRMERLEDTSSSTHSSPHFLSIQNCSAFHSVSSDREKSVTQTSYINLQKGKTFLPAIKITSLTMLHTLLRDIFF